MAAEWWGWGWPLGSLELELEYPFPEALPCDGAVHVGMGRGCSHGDPIHVFTWTSRFY